MKIVSLILVAMLPKFFILSSKGERNDKVIFNRQSKMGKEMSKNSMKDANDLTFPVTMKSKNMKSNRNNSLKTSKPMSSKVKMMAKTSKPRRSPLTNPTTAAPSPSDGASCMPTKGPCVGSYVELQNAISSATSNDVIGICGNDDTPIQTPSAITITKPNMTLCCIGQEDCVMQSFGSDRNLFIGGASSTLQGITFVNGTTDQSGGNVAVIADGVHRIIDCKFIAGTSTWDGGNLYVKTNDSVIVERSSFLNGRASGAGGLSVFNLSKISIVDSVFQGNIGPYGGGLLVDFTDFVSVQDVSITNTQFLENKGDYGGGFLASGFGTLPTLISFQIENCEFERNIAGFGGGAVAAFFYTDLNNVDISIQGNSGSENIALSSMPGENCSDLIFYFDISEQCVDVTEDFP